MKRFIPIIIVIVCFGVFYPRQTYSPTPVENATECVFDDGVLLREINLARKQPVRVNKPLDTYAQKRANSLNGQMDNHVGFRKTNDYLFSEFTTLSENLAGVKGMCITEKSFVESWLTSKLGHREVMLDSRYDYIGIGYYKGVVVTIFGDQSTYSK